MSRTTNRSPFAEALVGLLDRTALFDRAGWATVLGVTEAAISQWVGDKTIPRPDILFTILATLKRSTDVPQDPLREFTRVAEQPSTSVSPNGVRMLPTIWQYMTRPAFSELSGRLAKLPMPEQEKVLEEIYGNPISSPTANAVVAGATATSPVGPSDRAGTRPFNIHPVAHRASGGAPASSTWPSLPFRFRMVADADNREGTTESVGWDVMMQSQHVLLLGEPGIGKTRFMQYLAAQLGSGDRSAACTRYVALREISSRCSAEAADQLFGLPPNDEPVSILLDGFDELNEMFRNRIARLVSELLTRSSVAHVVVASRPIREMQLLQELNSWRIEPPTVTDLLPWISCNLKAKLSETGVDPDGAVAAFVRGFRERPEVLTQFRNPTLLAHVADLFVRFSVTARHDADLLGACLTLLIDGLDRGKRISRCNSPWARPASLLMQLYSLAYHSLVCGVHEFSSSEAESWLLPTLEDVSSDRIFRVLSELTGLLQPAPGMRWQLREGAYQEYLAARFIVESCDDATRLLRGRLGEPRMRNVIRFACAVTHDATHLIDFAVTQRWARREDQIVALAEILAQEPRADDGVLRRSSEAVIVWLTRSFDDWELLEVSETNSQPVPRWHLAARRRSHSNKIATPGAEVAVIRALHRARWSRAKAYIESELRNSTSPIVRSLRGCIDVDGVLDIEVRRSEGEIKFLAAVTDESLQAVAP